MASGSLRRIENGVPPLPTAVGWHATITVTSPPLPVWSAQLVPRPDADCATPEFASSHSTRLPRLASGVWPEPEPASEPPTSICVQRSPMLLPSYPPLVGVVGSAKPSTNRRGSRCALLERKGHDGRQSAGAAQPSDKVRRLPQRRLTCGEGCVWEHRRRCRERAQRAIG